MRNFLFLLFGLQVASSSVNSTPAPTVIQVVSRGDTNADYALQMLDLALSKADQPYEVKVKDGAYSTPRLRQDLIDGSIDVIWAATDQDMENNTLPVRVPLYKGLLGHRVLIVHQDNRDMFSNVRTFEDLKRYTFGQGYGWPDTEILAANGLDVVRVNKYNGLFYMIDGKRFDAFPRGIHEPWGEIAARPQLDLTVDDNIMLVYQMPYYLFVSPTRPNLAKTIEDGLKQAIADGSFDKVFFDYPMVQMVMEKAKLSGRRVFQLRNPSLPSATPLNDASLWLDVNRL